MSINKPISSKIMFNNKYPYRSSMSKTMIKSFVELSHEANERYRNGKSDLNAMSKESEMKVGDMKDTLSGFKFLTPKETKKSMKSGNLAKFLKGLDTPGGTVTTKFLP